MMEGATREEEEGSAKTKRRGGQGDPRGTGRGRRFQMISREAHVAVAVARVEYAPHLRGIVIK